MHQVVVAAKRFAKTFLGRVFLALAVIVYRVTGKEFWQRQKRDLPERLRKTGGL